MQTVSLLRSWCDAEVPVGVFLLWYDIFTQSSSQEFLRGLAAVALQRIVMAGSSSESCLLPLSQLFPYEEKKTSGSGDLAVVGDMQPRAKRLRVKTS